MLRVGVLLTGVMAVVGLAGCGASGFSGAQALPAEGPSYAVPHVHPDLGFGCPGGHLFDAGGAMPFSAKPFKGTIGYAANSGGLCAHVTASTSNVYNAPPPPSGWSALVYVEIKMADRHDGTWNTYGPYQNVVVKGKHALLSTSAYYCARWFVADGSQWTQEWSSATAHAESSKRVLLAGAPPDYTPYFNSQFVLQTETVLEVLQPPANDQC